MKLNLLLELHGGDYFLVFPRVSDDCGLMVAPIYHSGEFVPLLEETIMGSAPVSVRRMLAVSLTCRSDVIAGCTGCSTALSALRDIRMMRRPREAGGLYVDVVGIL